jgi:thioredoxin-like negative regulator of GroEL
VKLRPWLSFAIVLAGCAGTAKQVPPTALHAETRPQTPRERLSTGLMQLAASRYAEAEANLTAAKAEPALATQAALALSELFLLTGRAEQAIAAAQAAKRDSLLAPRAVELEVEALRGSGKLAEAELLLRPYSARTDAPALRLALGELLIDTGRRAQAEPILLSIVEDYNEERIGEQDGAGLARAARAAWLLRHPRDANTLFNEAEQATPADPKILLWRAELFLEKYDAGHAEEALKELLDKAPNHPKALTLLANVRLDQALDFDEAERLARQALKENPAFAPAYFVLAGVRLRDMELDAAEQQLAQGLARNPKDLELLSLRATARFLADDRPGFEREKQAVLKLNPEYSKFYAIVAEFADWEHRYDEIVELTREALHVDAEDAGALAQLGFNLIRAGLETEGVPTLSRAFRLDPYNVRVFNTLNLYEQVIPKSYLSADSPPFVIRYHKDDRAVLERYVPDLLKRAWKSMTEAYGFTPSVPVGIELYAERENFAIRTSGLPQTAIQGVCFGKTLASMSPQNEAFNLGMTLWHELSHVFHIQISKSRVPRWFTEGLAEYETTIARPEWAREHDPELYSMVRRGKLPSVDRMSRAFTRAEDIEDVATAYYASSQIVGLMAQRSGRGKMADLLRAWGKGLRGNAVFESVLGKGSADIDREFKAELDRRFARYENQFVPELHARPIPVLKELIAKSPRDANLSFELAFALLRSGEPERAAKQAEQTLQLDDKHAQARYLLARVALAANDSKRAEALLRAMKKDGQGGYAVELQLGEIARARGDVASARASFEMAAAADPTQGEPLSALADLAAAEKVPDEEARQLGKLALLSEHAPAVHRRYLARLLELGRVEEAVQAGEAAIWADIDGLTTHRLFAEALAKKGDLGRARFELETATLCGGDPKDRAEAHSRLAELLVKLRNPGEAKRHSQKALELSRPSTPQ